MTSERISRVWGIILLKITIFSLSLPAYAKYSGGTGEPNDPYRISHSGDLMLLSRSPEDYGKHFILTADMDLGGVSITPIAPDTDTVKSRFQGAGFTGVFEGNDHVIRNAYVNMPGNDFVGLFGYLGTDGQIRNLGIENISVFGRNNVGGLVGRNWGGTISNCYSTGSIDGTGRFVGGLVGENYGSSASIEASYIAGTVTGDLEVGGLVGRNSYFSSISTCYSTGTVSGKRFRVGGLVGDNDDGSSITISYSTGAVIGKTNVGGLVGRNRSGTITRCCSSGNVAGEVLVGGLVGRNETYWGPSTIIDCYSLSSVTATDTVGGLVGYNGSSIVSSYSSGPVTGNEYVGGLVGDNKRMGVPGNTTSSFWDIETSGQTESAGGEGKTTAEMQDINMYVNTGWDFVDETFNGICDYWQISPDDYPQLRYHYGESPVIPEGLGIAREPYLIRDARDLGTVWSEPLAHYRLEDSVDLSGITWSMAVVPWFGGTFNGNGYVISNLHIQGNGFLGLFGQLGPGAKISNLGLKAVEVNGTGDYVGGLVGDNHGAITACHTTGSVSGDWGVGGLVGSNYHGSSITTSYSTGTVTGNYYIGGLVGYNDGNIATSYSSGKVDGTGIYVGGFVGFSSLLIVSAGVWDTETSGLSVSGSGVGLTTTEMMDPYMLGLSGFADDPNWVLDAGCDYPRLAWEDTMGSLVPKPDIDWIDGSGTVETPYCVNMAEQLILLSKASIVWGKHFVLGADIDLDPTLPGRCVFGQSLIHVFTGVFDGNDHTISHLTIDGVSHLGLFGQLGAGAKISNLGLEAVDVNGIGDYIGGLVGDNDGNIYRCSSTGTVTGDDYVGGLVGKNYWGGNLSQCYNIGSVKGDSIVGGLVGSNISSTVYCFSTGTVVGKISVGGLVGANYDQIADWLSGVGQLAGCYSTANVDGENTIGGLVGDASWGSVVTNCFSSGPVSGTGQYIGGLIGVYGFATRGSFWDIETSGQATSDGGIGLTTSEMQTASTFLEAGWDFVGETANGTDDIWWILEGQDYPRLWWEESDL